MLLIRHRYVTIAMNPIQSIEANPLNTVIHQNDSHALTDALENGQILTLPNLCFSINPDEQPLLTHELIGNRKNIGYCPNKSCICGLGKGIEPTPFKNLLIRYQQFCQQLVKSLLQHYQENLITGRTSYRPAAIQNRATSLRKNDQLLHVDAFPATPVQNKRIMRIFANINQQGTPRHWRIGEQFDNILKRFMKKTRAPFWGEASLLHTLHLTKSKRTDYDHVMLQLHDLMKQDDDFQKNSKQTHHDFPAMSMWIVFTDLLPHAAMSGQFALEQTFYLDINAMRNIDLSPQRKIQAFDHLS